MFCECKLAAFQSPPCVKGGSLAVGGLLPSTLQVQLFFVDPAEKVIYRSFIKIRKFNQYRCGNIVFSGFVFGIPGLRHPQHLRDLLLGQILILS